MRQSRAQHLQAKADVLDKLMLRLEKGSAWNDEDMEQLKEKWAIAWHLQVAWDKQVRATKLNPTLKPPADSPAP
jgi:hypothetical protein